MCSLLVQIGCLHSIIFAALFSFVVEAATHLFDYLSRVNGILNMRVFFWNIIVIKEIKLFLRCFAVGVVKKMCES